jgi:hypothetical protein
VSEGVDLIEIPNDGFYRRRVCEYDEEFSSCHNACGRLGFLPYQLKSVVGIFNQGQGYSVSAYELDSLYHRELLSSNK